MSIAGVVLAGGTGRRFGGPKATALLNGVTLVDRAVAVLRDAGCDPLVVADGGDEGPLAALADALARVDADDVVVLACDLPLAAPVVHRLAALERGACAIAAGQPLCSRWPRAATAVTAARLVAGGARRMWALVDAAAPAVVLARDDELLNVNTRPDLARAALLLQN